MARRFVGCAACVVVVLALSGCARGKGTVNGTVWLEPKGTYLVGSTLVLRIVDVTSGETVAETGEVLTPGWEALSTQPPIDFAMDVAESDVDSRHKYVIWAEVDENGETVSVSPREMVMTRGAPSSGIELHMSGIRSDRSPIP